MPARICNFKRNISATSNELNISSSPPIVAVPRLMEQLQNLCTTVSALTYSVVSISTSSGENGLAETELD
jgi:hypothetical protein